MTFNNFLNWLSALILFFAIVLVFLISYSHLKKENLNKVEITYEFIGKDSVKIVNSEIEFKKIDSTLKKLEEFSHNIERKQLKLVEKQENTDYFNKFYSIIVAVILVIAGFFGYKNVAEIKQRAIEEAKEESKKTADDVAKNVAVEASKTEFNNIFTAQYKNEVFTQATEATTNLINGEIENLKKDIAEINIKIGELELRSSGASGNVTDIIQDELRNIVEPENPFDDNDQ
ncbi:hypothetical protein [Chryseobacterium luquanense]|uniref:Uncharacterized protein n=1 Tax=Chryseobacterium luquanense TaxID=2983766 RepID=A0ABT3XYA5_9FLAO|nr:hypothetical protein [Chryseobacterium luquanense]MCX8530857.1 hypothetical protein [Chryseobacterium luquanense]